MSSPETPASTREAILIAAADLFSRGRGASVALEDIADAAGVSRQTLYLHFGSRTGLLIAMVEHIDAGGTLPPLIERVFAAPSAARALDAVVSLHATYYPTIYPVAKAFMATKHEDEAMRVAWEERMESRRNLYRQVVEWLVRDRVLAPGWTLNTATDMLWALTSWELWEQLVLDRRWSADEYERHLRTALRRTLLRGRGASRGGSARAASVP